MNRTKSQFAFAAALVLVAVMVVRAQSTPGDAPPAAANRTISAEGTGTIYSRPDSVRIYLGVVTQSETVAAAREENARTVAKIQEAILALKLRDLKAKTRDTKVQIVKRREEGMEVKGYRVSQSFSVVFQSTEPDELATAAGRILDAGLQNGVNDHGDVEFFLADESELERQAKTKAVEDALANAAALADGAKLKIIDVVEIQDQASSGYRDAGFGGQQGGFGRRETASGLFAGDWQVSASVRIVCRY
ncbi:MAG: DUF541 domain-containing protein [Planctomycetaceae bacterium]|nr:DUF541 domain-containing protein [Planctomycetaceae bacterium]